MGAAAPRLDTKQEPTARVPREIPGARLQEVETTPSDQSELVLPTDPRVQSALRAKLSEYDSRKMSAPDGSALYIDSMYKSYVLQQLLANESLNIAELRATVVPENTLGPINHGQVFDNAVLSIQDHIDEYSQSGSEATAPSLEAVPQIDNSRERQVREVSRAAVGQLLERISEAAGDDAGIQGRLDGITFEYIPGNSMSATEYADGAFERMILTGDAQLVTGNLEQHVQQFESALASNPRELTNDDIARGIIAETRRLITEDPSTRLRYFESIQDPNVRLTQLKTYFGLAPSEHISADTVNRALDRNLYQPYSVALEKSGLSATDKAARLEQYDDQLAVLEDLVFRTYNEATGARESTNDSGDAVLEMPGDEDSESESATDNPEEDWLSEQNEDDWLDDEPTTITTTEAAPAAVEVIDRQALEDRISSLQSRLENAKTATENEETGLWSKMTRFFKDLAGVANRRRQLTEATSQLHEAELQLRTGDTGAAENILRTLEDRASIDLKLPEASINETSPDTTELERRFFGDIDTETREANVEVMRERSLLELENALYNAEKEIKELTPSTGEAILLYNPSPKDRQHLAMLMDHATALRSAILSVDRDKDPYDGKIYTDNEVAERIANQENRVARAVEQRGRTSLDSIIREYASMTPMELESERERLLRDAGMPEMIKEPYANLNRLEERQLQMMREYMDALTKAGATDPETRRIEAAAYDRVLSEQWDRINLVEDAIEESAEDYQGSEEEAPVQTLSPGRRVMDRRQIRNDRDKANRRAGAGSTFRT